MNILDYNNFYLVGIKGVAMTGLVQILKDASKKVSGSDVAEDFVTQEILKKLSINPDVGFDRGIPKDVDCVVYTSAHKGPFNQQVLNAQEKGIQTFSHAEALGEVFNLKKGIAVCGVGGKSSSSAMIAWILEKTGRQPSFAVGVGNIQGLGKTAQWDSQTDIFVAEADEYVTDPSAPSRNEDITPRFSYLNPFITICTNLKFDHPDVYKNFEHTKEAYFKFFNQIDERGTLILNHKDLKHNPTTSAGTTLTFGESKDADFSYSQNMEAQKPGINAATIIHNNETYSLELQIPGKYNIENAVAAIVACSVIGVPIMEAIDAVHSFQSTQRRFELRGTKNGVTYYDDYAHHPNEISSVIKALNDWYPNSRKVIAFQPHTYSRTKELLTDFINSFSKADEVVMLDIFASAREEFDSSITTDMIVEGIKKHHKSVQVVHVKTVHNLSVFCESELNPGDILLTIGAGDIYKVHDLI